MTVLGFLVILTLSSLLGFCILAPICLLSSWIKNIRLKNALMVKELSIQTQPRRRTTRLVRVK